MRTHVMWCGFSNCLVCPAYSLLRNGHRNKAGIGKNANAVNRFDACCCTSIILHPLRDERLGNGLSQGSLVGRGLLQGSDVQADRCSISSRQVELCQAGGDRGTTNAACACRSN